MPTKDFPYASSDAHRAILLGSKELHLCDGKSIRRGDFGDATRTATRRPRGAELVPPVDRSSELEPT